MFPMQMPEMPQEIMDAVAADPGAFMAALGQGMEAFQGAMSDGGDMGAAFEAMGDVMGPVMEGMGVSPEAFDAAGDAFGAAIGGGMHMAPADCGGPEMGAIMQDAVDMMMPEEQMFLPQFMMLLVIWARVLPMLVARHMIWQGKHAPAR